jgi:hypothetical protein
MLGYLRQHSWFAWLGLFAFASQIVLTLGHVHVERGYGLTRAHSAQFARHFDAGHHAVAPAEFARHHGKTPADPNDLGGWCAYCWTIAQAASLILPKPAKIQLGRLQQTFPLPYRSVRLSSGSETSPFESRGPPLTSRA